MTNRMLLFSKALGHSGWLLESLQSSRIHRPVFVCGKETPAFFFPAEGNPLRVGKALLSPPLLLEMKSHSLFSWRWWSVLCLHCQSKTLSWSAQCAKHKENTGFPRMGFCLGFTLIYAPVSSNLSPFCTFSKCWKCFFSFRMSFPPRAKLHTSESKLEFGSRLQTLETYDIGSISV